MRQTKTVATYWKEFTLLDFSRLLFSYLYDRTLKYTTCTMHVCCKVPITKNLLKPNSLYQLGLNLCNEDKTHLVFDVFPFQPGRVAVFASTANLDTFAAEHKYRDDTLYYQLVTTAGVHRVYPGVTVPDNYDPLQEAW